MSRAKSSQAQGDDVVALLANLEGRLDVELDLVRARLDAVEQAVARGDASFAASLLERNAGAVVERGEAGAGSLARQLEQALARAWRVAARMREAEQELDEEAGS